MKPKDSPTMTPAELAEIRERLGYTQVKMANELGSTIRLGSHMSMTATARLKVGAKWVATGALLSAGVAAVVVAGWINYDASVSQPGHWPWGSIVSTALTAALLKVALLLWMRRKYAASVLMIVLAAPFFAQNWVTASGNSTSADKHIEEARVAHDTDAKGREDRRQAAVKRRDKAEAAADGETEQSALNKIERIKAEHPSAWNRSNGCDTAQIRNATARQVCADIAALRAKADAAKTYATAVATLDGIAAESRASGTIAAQSTSKGAGATIKAFSMQLGHEMTNEEGERFFEHQRGLCLELAAAIGPSVAWLLAWLLLWAEDEKKAEASKARASAPVSEPKPRGRVWIWLASRASRIAARRKEAEILAFPAGSAQEFRRRYLADSDDPNDRIRGGDMQKRYAEDCARLGVDGLQERMLSQGLQACGVVYRKTGGGRPYYHGVKWRAVPLPAAIQHGPRIVVDNTVSPAASALG